MMHATRALPRRGQSFCSSTCNSAAGRPRPLRTRRCGVRHPARHSRARFMFSTSVSRRAVRARSGTFSTIGPRPQIWCSAGTGLFSHGCASPAHRHRPAPAAGPRDPRTVA
jgi:hypothetical protein